MKENILMRKIFILLIVLFSFKAYANNSDNSKILQLIFEDSELNKCLAKYGLVDSSSFLLIGKPNTYLVDNGVVNILEKSREFEQPNTIQLKKMKIKDEKAKISFSKSNILVKVTLHRDSIRFPWYIRSRFFCRLCTKKHNRIFYWSYGT